LLDGQNGVRSQLIIQIFINNLAGINNTDVTDIFSEIGSNSLKIAITKNDGVSQIYGEIEEWDSVNKKGLIWVSSSDLVLSSSGPTDLYIYYDSTQNDNTNFIGTAGNRPEVWNSNFVAVYTMAQDPSAGAGCIIDSSGNGNNGTPNGGMTSGDLVEGQIGKAIQFDGVDDYIDCGNAPSFDLTSEFTIDFFFKPNDTTTLQNIINKWDYPNATGNKSYIINIGATGDSIQFGTFDGNDKISTSSNIITPGNWYYVSVVFSAGNFKQIRINGADETLTTGDFTAPTQTGNNPFLIADPNHPFNGIISNLRVRNIAYIGPDYHALTDNLLQWGATELM